MQFQSNFSPAALDPLDLPAETRWLVGQGILSYDVAAAARAEATQRGVTIGAVLLSDHGLSEFDLARSMAIAWNARLIDPCEEAADPLLLAEYGPKAGLQRLVLPWRKQCGVTIVLTARPDLFYRHLPSLKATFGKVRMAIAPPSQIRKCIMHTFGSYLATCAETKLAKNDSCRDWKSDVALICLLVSACAATIWIAFAPSILFAVLTLWTVGNLGILTLLNLLALFAVMKMPQQHLTVSPNTPLPAITFLVPLFKERAIAEHLLKRIEALDYPRSLLDVCLVLEADDDTTRATLAETRLPFWARTLTVPKGSLQTKPRALNYALDTARGSIIGIYDAEDAPQRNQLLIVADRFSKARANTACLQGTLDYYNPRANWLTRCFSIEYASWFRVVLPGYARLGLAVPLGGTTLFFRRDILEKLGGWDAHNVTEDADLGLRLARQGYLTEFIPTVTEEEANGHVWPWVRQRSRWLKGYGMTYLVHMRNPRRLWRDLGSWRFFGVQMLFLGTLTQFLLAPLLWSFWLIPFGGTHPLSFTMPEWVVIACTLTCIASAIVNFIVQATGVSRAGKRWLMPWATTMLAYFPLGTLAAYKGMLELAWKPFFWDKTTHGVLMPQQDPYSAASTAAASNFRRVL